MAWPPQLPGGFATASAQLPLCAAHLDQLGVGDPGAVVAGPHLAQLVGPHLWEGGEGSRSGEGTSNRHL